MRARAPLKLLALLALCACAPAQPRPRADQPPQAPNAGAQPADRLSRDAALVSQAAKVLRELRADSPYAALDAALEDARAVIILPGVYHAGFIYSVQGGDGVLIARRSDGGWGAPVFVTSAGVGCGIQAGVERSRVVLAVMEEEMLERILANGLNFDANTKYDILGVREETGPDTRTANRPVQVFTDGAGLMAGVAFRGAILTPSRERSAAYHGGTPFAEAMRDTDAPGMEVFELWSALGVAPRGPEIIRSPR
jgi:lipid-binding SYLF domain-containing protein